jgi:hypothetical protein
MPVERYGVTRDDVMAYLPQWGVSGDTLTGYNTIDSFIETAAAEVGDALNDAGHGFGAGSDESLTPYAWRLLHDLVAYRASVIFARTIVQNDSLNDSQKKSDDALAELRRSPSIGELSTESNSSVGVFLHGSTSRDSLNGRRFAADGEL